MKSDAIEPKPSTTPTTPKPPSSSSSRTKISKSSELNNSQTISAATTSSNPNSNNNNRYSSSKPPTYTSDLDSYGSFLTGGNTNNSSSSSSSSIITSTSNSTLSSLRVSLPETAYIYDFKEIATATNNFLAKRYSSSSSSAWKCSLRGKNVLIFQRKFRRSIETSQLRERLSFVCKSHHMSLIKLLGASISGDHIYLVYDFVNGSNLAHCLRNPKNPSYTVLSNWNSRMQIAADIAQGLEYIHHYTGLNRAHVHNYIKSTSVIVTEPSFNAKICHFGTAELCGEINRDQENHSDTNTKGDSKLKRSDSRNMKFEGTRGYMSAEFQIDGIATQKSDVFAFGIVILELLTGEEPLKYRFDKEKGDYKRVSVIETAKDTIESDEPGRIRRWIDRRMKDSYPVEIAEKMTRLALECVDVDPEKRPDMRHVSGKVSKLYLQSRKWAEKLKVPTDMITVSLGPR
ncbi:Lysm domain receptor-like kinase [Thalictrum thalictroides]|uniref:Lysm domain receptor-like kinase n=1 Tax=Thalictrum thalictroides TaxID=46969 RepID=A0A7J6XAG4_THATH|nr:Lysm domain receptor-like kinase [Thalictrum thalictroides]